MHAEINEIRVKQLNSPWPKFLRSVTLTGFRGWSGQEVRFEFPVVVIAGENGTGKSTILKAAAVAYANPTDKRLTYYPGTFFPDTPWDGFANSSITYKVKDGFNEKTYKYNKPKERWRVPTQSRSKRHVFYQDISRTLPIDGTAGYASIAKKSAIEISADILSPELTLYYSSILGRKYDEARWAICDQSPSKKVGVVKVPGAEFSQFHQGAGEDATFDLISLLQNAASTSLVLIDEVEASLHPRSQRRLIHFLLWLARTKQIQVIISTHSPYVIEELPKEARIFLSRGSAGVEVLYGVTPEFALNRMDDIDRPDLYLFTEDEEASVLIKELLRVQAVEVGRIRFTPAGSCEIIKVLGQVAKAGSLPVKSLGVLDADQGIAIGCIRLPGTEAPEKQVLKDILANASSYLATRLEMPESKIKDALAKGATKTNHHDWIGEAARFLDNQAADFLWANMCQVWVKHCTTPEEREALATEVNKFLKP